MAVKEKTAATFTKHQVLSAKKYAERRDLLMVLMTDDKVYTLAEVDRLIEEFMKKEFDKPKAKGAK